MIDHDRKFIFLHIPRTGGSSISRVLGVSRGHDDVFNAKERYAEWWSEYFKFAFVRNPFSWLVSLAFCGSRPTLWTFEEYVRLCARREKVPWTKELEVNAHTRLHRNVEGLDFVGRLENIDDDFVHVCQEVEVDGELPHVSRGKHMADYRPYYIDGLREFVEEQWAEDFARFGYSF